MHPKLKSFFNIAGAAGQPSWDQERNSFFKAVKNNDAATVRAIGVRYPDCIQWNNGKTPLEIAMKHDAKDAFDALIAMKADVNAPLSGSNGYLLHRAIDARRLDFADKLIAAGADCEKKAERQVANGIAESFTALALAIRNNDDTAVKFLMDRGACTNGICTIRTQNDWDCVPQYSSPVQYAQSQKKFALADLIARKDREACSALQAPAAAEPEAESCTGTSQASITVRAPLRLKSPGT